MLIIALFDPTMIALAPESGRLEMISLGCVLENMWLTAHVHHLDVQVLSALGADGTEAEVKRTLAIPEPWRIAFALRVGHALSVPALRHDRRDPAAIVGRNRFA
jgi:nitroreductase